MKRVLTAAAAIMMMVLLAVSVSAASAVLTPTVNGSTLTVTVSLNCSDPVKSMMIVPQYDSNVLTMQSGEWKLSGILSDNWSDEIGDAVICFESGQLLSGIVFEMRFAVTDAAAQQTTVSCEVIAKTEVGDDEIPLDVSVTGALCTLSSGGSSLPGGDSGSQLTPAEDAPVGIKPTEPIRIDDPVTPVVTESVTDPVVSDGTWQNPFRDISVSDPYYDAIRFVYERELFKGVSETEFAPATTMTRAMFVTVLGRLAGVDENSFMRTSFTDTDPVNGFWYIGYVEWASQSGIVKGYGDGRFGPNDMVTVEQATVILARYAEYVGRSTAAGTTFSAYADGDQVSDWARPAMAWALVSGIYTANGGFLTPGAYAPRSLVATMLYRYVITSAN